MTGRSRVLGFICFWAALAAGVILLVSAFASSPRTLFIAALAVLLASAFGILALSFMTARRQGKPFAASLARAGRDAARWLFDFAP